MREGEVADVRGLVDGRVSRRLGRSGRRRRAAATNERRAAQPPAEEPTVVAAQNAGESGRCGATTVHGELVAAARGRARLGPLADPDTTALPVRVTCPSAIRASARGRQANNRRQRRLVRCILDSLACALPPGARQIEAVTDRKIESSIRRGGAHNRLLCHDRDALDGRFWPAGGGHLVAKRHVQAFGSHGLGELRELVRRSSVPTLCAT